MREIKFRAWNKARECMDIEPLTSYANSDWSVGLNEFLEDPFDAATGDPLILMQYTGLKDKNGKDIYEGDILKFKSRKVSTVIDGVRQDVMRDNLGVVYFDTGKAGGPSAEFNCTEVGGNDQPSWWMCSLKEVIGNIYENGDLLK